MQPDKCFSDALGPSYTLEGRYSAVLNQTDIKSNINKFYIIQVFKHSSSNQWKLGKRYGRVGEKGNLYFDNFTTNLAAVSEFKKVYRSKTGNNWGVEFVPKKGKYTLLAIDDDDDTATTNIDVNTSSISKLETRLQSFLRLISNKDMMRNCISKMDLDAKKLPLGKITKKQLADANIILKELADYLGKEALISVRAALDVDEDSAQEYIDSNVAELSSKYWTIIPYATKRSRPPPLIDTLKDVQSQSENLDVLYNIGIFGRMKTTNSNVVDSIYEAMNIKLEALDEKDATRDMLCRYVENTHGHSHGYALEVRNVYAATKERSASDDELFNKLPNHVLLFHGSRMPNFVGILTEGLRIPQATQVANGSVLGVGIYFANCVTKSFNYCGTYGIGDTGVMLVCEVALGNTQVVTHATFDYKPPSQFDSRTALGKNAPDDSVSKTTLIETNRVLLPYGKLKPSPHTASSFIYDEFVIFNPAQYRIRWVMELISAPLKTINPV